MSESERRYRSTESKYKGGARERYVTYDLSQRVRSGDEAVYPKVKRVYIAGDVKDWSVGDFTKRSGRTAHGVKIDYEQSRSGYRRKAYTAKRGSTSYRVGETRARPTAQRFSVVVDVPVKARNIRFQQELPEAYKDALQNVR